LYQALPAFLCDWLLGVHSGSFLVQMSKQPMGINLKLPQNPISVLFEVLKLVQVHFAVSGEFGLTIFEISLTSHGKTLVEMKVGKSRVKEIALLIGQAGDSGTSLTPV
jgi:hypothetical protein